MKTININRRHFLKGTTAMLAFSAFGARGLDLINPAQPYRVGLIGAGWYGKSDLFRLIQVVPIEVIAICDVDKNQREGAADVVQQRIKGAKRPKFYGDYRKMLAENQLDIVLIGSPDHWHALQAIEAIKSGANVYLQKPISVDVIEGEAILAAARKYNKAVQIGTQRRSTPHILEVKDRIVDAGLLGKVSHVEMRCDYPMRRRTVDKAEPVPDFLDFDMWTGPAPLKNYTGLPHRGWWRSYMEYGNGITGDMCVHMFDTVRWLLDLGWPKKITSTGGIYVNKESSSNTSDTQGAFFEYDELNCFWQHRSWGTPTIPEYPWSFTLFGDKGTLIGSTMQCDFTPARGSSSEPIHVDVLFEREKFPEDNTEPSIEMNAAPATRMHMLNLLDAIENKKRPVADVEEGHLSTASCILANMSMKLNRTLEYDPVKRIVKNDPEATKLLQREYRSPWEHPDPDKV